MAMTLKVILSTFLNLTFNTVEQKYPNSTPLYTKYINVKNLDLNLYSNLCIYLPFLPVGSKYVKLIANKLAVVVG
jgi:hypothetical protein